MSKRKNDEGAQFVKYFGPLLDALRKLGGSGTPDEVAEQIATNINLSDELQNELLPSGEPRYRNQVAWARFSLVREGFWIPQSEESGVSRSAAAPRPSLMSKRGKSFSSG